jgi:hypothetical protein
MTLVGVFFFPKTLRLAEALHVHGRLHPEVCTLYVVMLTLVMRDLATSLVSVMRARRG